MIFTLLSLSVSVQKRARGRSRKGTASDNKIHCRLTDSPRQVWCSSSLCSQLLKSGNCFLCIMALEHEDEWSVGGKEEVCLLILAPTLSLGNSLLLWTVFRTWKLLELCVSQDCSHFFSSLQFSHLPSSAIAVFLFKLLLLLSLLLIIIFGFLR